MTFEQAVGEAGLAHAYCRGLSALGANKAHLACHQPRLLTGSIDLDAALRADHPDAARWDYGVGLTEAGRERAVWVEVHPANASHVDQMLAKLKWLRCWLRDCAPDLKTITLSYHWVATGRVALRHGSPQYFKAARAGLLPKRSPLPLPPD